MENKVDVLVQQRSTYDCVLACLCMATGQLYEKLWDEAFCKAVEDAKGTGAGNLHEQAFAKAGLLRDVDFTTIYCESIPPPTVRKLLWGRRALLQVPSLNFDGSMHYVYWDGEQLYDPSRARTYRFFNTLAATPEPSLIRPSSTCSVPMYS